ncbi:hypothetical protein VNO78_33279 [Psophocarpus tetragonolobus]|uniref:Uncharacterized protein n=1 Tax=Psophocarpus tetragonolobus TaxID=3891 RepID=A0AAN9NX36_PSOTE
MKGCLVLSRLVWWKKNMFFVGLFFLVLVKKHARGAVYRACVPRSENGFRVKVILQLAAHSLLIYGLDPFDLDLLLL